MTLAKKKLKKRGPNRGPQAAHGNREALLTAARKVFAEKGYRAPLSAIATEAGVGQAVLYRHFPTRLALAHAAFEENLLAYEKLIAHPGARVVHELWERLCDDLIDSAAFVEMTVDARREASSKEDGDRMATIAQAAVKHARAGGTVPEDFSAEELLLGIRMAYGIVVTSLDVERAALRKSLYAALPRLPR